VADLTKALYDTVHVQEGLTLQLVMVANLYDTVQWSEEIWLCMYQRPTSDYGTEQLINYGASPHYACVNKIVLDYATYVYTGSSSIQIDRYGSSPMPIRSGPIRNVTIKAAVAVANNSTVELGVQIGGTDYTSPNLVGGSGTISKSFNTNPSTGNPWTYSDVDGLIFHLGLNSGTLPNDSDCYQIWAEVAFVPIPLVSLNDNVNVLEAITTYLNIISLSLYDTITVSELVTAFLPVLTASFYDTVDVQEQFGVALPITTSISDTVDVLESQVMAFSWTISLFDTVQVSESLSFYEAVGLNLYDTVNVQEQIIPMLPVLTASFYDTAAVSEGIIPLLPVLLAVFYDTLNVQEAVTPQLVLSISFYNTVNVQELIGGTLAFAISIYDTMAVSEQITAGMAMAISLYDTVKAMEQLTITMPLANILLDVAQISEHVAPALLVSVSFYDTIKTTEQLATLQYRDVLVAIYDTIAFSEWVEGPPSRTTAAVRNLTPTRILYPIRQSEPDPFFSAILYDTINIVEQVAAGSLNLLVASLYDTIMEVEYFNIGNLNLNLYDTVRTSEQVYLPALSASLRDGVAIIGRAGTAYTDMTDLNKFYNVFCADSNGTVRLIGGNGYSNGYVPRLYKYRNGVFTDLSSRLIGWVGTDVRAILAAGDGTFLIASNNLAALNVYDPVADTMTALSLTGIPGGPSLTFGLGWNGKWLVSSSSHVYVYGNGSWTDTGLVNYGWPHNGRQDSIVFIQHGPSYSLVAGLTGELWRLNDDDVTITELSSYTTVYHYEPYNDYHQIPPNDIYYSTLCPRWNGIGWLMGSGKQVNTTDSNTYPVLIYTTDLQNYTDLSGNLPQNGGTEISNPPVWTGAKWVFIISGLADVFIYDGSTFTETPLNSGSPYYAAFNFMWAYQDKSVIVANGYIFGELALAPGT